MESLGYFLMPILNPKLLLLTVIGTVSGVWVGAIPGLSVTMAASLLISFTFSWDLYSALALICGVYMGGVYGGAITAILINIPGAPAAIATSFDGYPLAQRGEAGRAIGMATIASLFGGLIGVLVLVIAGPIVAKFALGFGPREYFLLGIMGILLITSMGQGSVVKGLIAGALGVLLSTVGLDPSTGELRYTFGTVYLMQGISFIPAMIGLFGVSEALLQLRGGIIPPIKQFVDKVIPDFKTFMKYIPLVIRSSLIGVWIGALPGTGGDVAALIAYDSARRTIKRPSRPFGQGAYEGVIAPETANNAAIGGAFIPMLTLGIPGDAVTAIIIGALFIHGLKPGPLLMIETPQVFWVIVSCLIISSVAMVVWVFSTLKVFLKVVEIPKHILMPIIVMLSVIGTYAIQNSLIDVYWMLGFGILGYFMRLYGYAVGPMVLGIILGPIIETNFRRAMQLAENSPLAFVKDLFSYPISFVLTIAIIYMIVSQLVALKGLRKRGEVL